MSLTENSIFEDFDKMTNASIGSAAINDQHFIFILSFLVTFETLVVNELQDLCMLIRLMHPVHFSFSSNHNVTVTQKAYHVHTHYKV